MKSLILSFLLLTFAFSGTARAEEDHHSFGVEGGEVQLSGNVGGMYGNALGLGAFFNYAASDYLELQFDWLNSHHASSAASGQSMNQNSYQMTLLWNIDWWDIFTPYLRGGAEFVTHNQDITDPITSIAANYNTTAFGLDLGAGAKVDISRNFIAGIDFTYHSMFDTTVMTPSGAMVDAIQSYFTVLLRLGFAWGGR